MLNRQILELAGRQFGVVGRTQLTDPRSGIGVSTDAIFRARKSGKIVDVLPGVYRIASSPTTFESLCMAVQLRSDGIGYLSGFTAARLRGLRRMPENYVHFTVPTRSRIRVPGWVHLHRSTWFEGADCETLPSGLVVASPMRMLFGLAADFNRHRFSRAAEDAWHLKLVTPSEAATYLEAHRCRGKNGVARLEEWLERALDHQGPAQSELERLVLDQIERVGLPAPERQWPLRLANGERIKLDIAWPAIRLAVEPGASWFHGGDEKMDKDQARDRACLALGWMVIRFTETMRLDIGAAVEEIRRIRAQRIRDLGPTGTNARTA